MKNSLFWSLLESVTWALTMTTSAEVFEEGFGLCGNQGLKYGTEVNQCCSGAQWVPIEVLEDGYGHRIGL